MFFLNIFIICLQKIENWKKIQSFFISPVEIIEKIKNYEVLFKRNDINEGTH